MEDIILITELNDFIFCPASIYFHHLYGSRDPVLFQSEAQIKGTKAHAKFRCVLRKVSVVRQDRYL